MSIQHFSSGAQFVWQNCNYMILSLLPNNQVNIKDIDTGAMLVVEMSMLVEALFEGDLCFVVKGKYLQKDGNNTSKNIELSDYPEKWVALARYRFEVIMPLLNIENRTLKDIEKRVEETKLGIGRNSVSVASVYRWIKDYTKSDNDLRSLIPAFDKCGSKGKTRLPKEIEGMIDKVINDKYYVREKVTIKDIRNELAVRIAETNCSQNQEKQIVMPSESTLTRRIKALAPYKKTAAKQGTRVAKQSFSQYQKTPYPTIPLERVEIDHTISDLIIIDDRDNLPLGRLTLTYCLDMATRYPLGYYLGFEPPSYLSVMECLYHAILPKENMREKYSTKHQWLAYGIPSVLMVDNGKEFIGNDLQDACLLLGIVLQQAPVRTPHFKAGIERNYHSLNTMFFHTLPGTTFSNSQDRGDYNSAEQACIYLSDIDKMLTTFIVDIYAQQFHRGLNGIPAHCWIETTKCGFIPGLPPSAKELSILLGRTIKRVIHHYGIEFSYLRYNCNELVTLRTQLKGEKAKIKYHPADLSYLHVYDPFERKYIRVPALDQSYTKDLSLWKHRIVRQKVLSEQDQVDIVALGQAKRKIQKIVEESRHRKRKQTRSKIARWDTSGKPTHHFTEMQAKADKSTECNVDNKIIPFPKRTDAQIEQLLDSQTDSDWEIVYHKNLLKNKKEKLDG